MTRKRAQVRLLYDKVKMAIDDVQYMQEKIKRKEEDKETVSRQGRHAVIHTHGSLRIAGRGSACP